MGARAPARRTSRLVLAVVAAAMTTFGSTPASAGGIRSEPWTRWRTEHFVVHVHQAAEGVGERIAGLVDAAYDAICDRFGWEVPRTDLVVEDRTDSANGFANVVPWNRITVHGVPPTFDSALGYYDNWAWNLVVHEFTHIAHIGRVGGFPKLANQVLDTEFAPNQALPRWFTEGLATWFESEVTGTGRLNSAYFDAWWRGPALGGEFPGMGALAGPAIEWPYASGWYLYGSHFIRFLVDQHGIDALARFIDLYGRQVVPFRINELARKVLGTGLVDEWPAFAASMEGRAWGDAVVARASGGAVAEPITRGGNATRFVTLDPSGNVAWLDDDGYEQRSIVVDTPGGRIRREVESGGEFAFLDDRTVVIDQPHPVARYYSFRDLYAVDLLDGTTRPLTWGRRAREPAVSPDGRTVVFTSHVDGRTDLVALDMRSGAVTTVFRASTWAQAASPAWTPDGRVVFAYLEPGEGRDLYLLDPDAGSTTRLTFDGAFATDPSVVPRTSERAGGEGGTGGDWQVLFSSDRSGIHDVYVLHSASLGVRRLTHEATGAFAPRLAPDGRLLYARVGTLGFDVVSLAVGADPWEVASPAGPVAHPMRPAPVVSRDAERLPGGAPIRSLRGPDWTIHAGVGSFTSRIGLRLAGSDAPGVNRYDLSAAWTFRHSEPVGTAAFSTAKLPVGITISGGRRLVERSGRYFAESRDIPFVEEQYVASVGVRIPFPRRESHHTLALDYNANFYSFLDDPDVVPDPVDLQPVRPRFLRFNELRLQWAWADVDRFARSYTATRGTRLNTSLGVRSPALGAEVESADISASVSRYRQLPWGRHVLASRVAGGLTEARGISRREFVLGGAPAQDVFIALRDRTPIGSGSIRGYQPGVRQGNRFYRGQVDYRFPLWDFGAGVGTIPLFVERLHGAVFVDSGLATNDRLAFDDMLVGVGAELRLATVIGYTDPADFRAGFARGFGRDGTWDVYLLYGFEY